MLRCLLQRCACLIGVVCLLLAGARAAPTWSAQVWDADSLGSLHINGIAQSRDGFLWVATPAAIHRFDGGRFVTSPPEALQGKAGDRVATIAPGRDAGIWSALEGGRIVRVSGDTIQAIQAGPADLSPDDMLEDRAGALWIVYHGGTLVRVTAGQATTFNTGDVPATGNCSLALDTAGELWLARGGTVGRVQNGVFAVEHAFRVPMVAIASAANGGVWACSSTQLFRLTAGAEPESHGSLAPASRSVHPSVMLEDCTGAVWIGTTDIGLLRYTASGVESVPTSFRRINHLAEDAEGNLWVGTGGGGLNRIYRGVLRIEGSVTGFARESVQSLCEDAHGELWAATQGGQLVVRAGDEWTTPKQPGAPRGGVTCVASDPHGGVWIGTRLQRIHHYHDGRFQTFAQAEGVLSRTTHALLVSRAGDVWLVGDSPNAVQRLRAGRFESIALPNTTCRPVRVAEDAAGRIWIGTAEGAVFHAEGDALVEVPLLPAGHVERPVSCFLPTATGGLWIGYERNGLGYWRDGRYVHLGLSEGLPSDDIRLLASDASGALWVASGRGIFALPQPDLESIVPEPAARVHALRYTGGGAPLLATRTESNNALRTRDGKLWFPMGAALAIVTPENARRAAAPSPVRITQVAVDEAVWATDQRPAGSPRPRAAPFAEGGEVVLPSTHRKIEIEFACLSFDAPENVAFRYRLLGFDENWTEVGRQCSATYSRLAPGSYRFELTACNSAGVWSATPVTLGLTVPPRLWQRTWFQAILLLVFTGVIAAIVRAVSYRRLHQHLAALEKQAAVERERSRIARDIHDDVGNRLTRILMLSRLAERDRKEPAKTLDHLRQISAAAGEVTDSLDEIVWAVNPRNDTLAHLLDYVGQYAVEFLRTAGIPCACRLPDVAPPHPVSAEVRHNFFLAFKEALHNVVRHSGATEVRVTVAIHDEELQATVEDNGRGIVRPAGSEENGLENMHARMAELDGRCEITSQPGHGTQIRFVFRWVR